MKKKYECMAGMEGMPLPRQCIGMLILANRSHRARAENTVSNIGIHRSQHHLLMYLAKRETFPSQKDIAEDLGISPAAVAVALKKLEKNGFIERSSAEDDSRKNNIGLSEKGAKAVEESKVMFDTLDRTALAGFTEEEMKQFISMLGRINENLRDIGKTAKKPDKQ